MKKLLSMLPVIAALVLMSSCEKKEDSLSKTDLLCKAPWKITAGTVNPAMPAVDANGNFTTTNDYFSQLEDCDKDDTEKYDKTGKVTYDNGTAICDPEAPQTTTGMWVFNTDETIITESSAEGTFSYKIIELTSDVMKVEMEQVIMGTNYTFTLTLKH